jgi:hypothetical protein
MAQIALRPCGNSTRLTAELSNMTIECVTFFSKFKIVVLNSTLVVNQDSIWKMEKLIFRSDQALGVPNAGTL